MAWYRKDKEAVAEALRRGERPDLATTMASGPLDELVALHEELGICGILDAVEARRARAGVPDELLLRTLATLPFVEQASLSGASEVVFREPAVLLQLGWAPVHIRAGRNGRHRHPEESLPCHRDTLRDALRRVGESAWQKVQQEGVQSLYQRQLVRGKVYAVDGSGLGDDLRLVALVCVSATRPIIVAWRLLSGPASEKGKEAAVTRSLIEQVLEMAGPKAISLLLADALYADGPLLAWLKDRKELAMKGGFPRFKKGNQWHSIQLRQYTKDVYLHEDKKHLIIPAKMGKSIKIKMHRPIEGKPKTVHLVLRADNHWYALIVCETEPQTEHLPSECSHAAIGIDVGLTSFLTDSEGTMVENPRYYRTSQRTLRRKQRTLCRRKKGSHRRRAAAKNVAKTHLKIDRQRRDFHFKTAKPYAENYHHIAVEDLQITNMVRNHHLAKSIMDASWGAFLALLEDKAERAGHHVIRVNPRFTSQNCHTCGEIVQKSLSVRTHMCPFCGYVADRDVNAALNILQRARPGHGLQEPTYKGT